MKATGYDDKESESKSATTLDYIVAFIAIAGSAGSGPISPDLDALSPSRDSLGNVYPATYDRASWSSRACRSARCDSAEARRAGRPTRCQLPRILVGG